MNRVYSINFYYVYILCWLYVIAISMANSNSSNNNHHHPRLLSLLIQQCRYEIDVDKQFALLQKINSLLPKTSRLRMPSLITDDYIRTALDTIDDYLLDKKHTLIDKKLNVMYDSVA